MTPWGAEVLKKRKADNSKDNPEAHCLPMGIIQFHTQGAPRKFYQTPGALVILYEASSGVRQIFTDGRPLPDDDPQPWWYGYSTGKWDGDTLVVRDDRFPRRWVARHLGQPVDVDRKSDGAVPARELRTDGDRHHD